MNYLQISLRLPLKNSCHKGFFSKPVQVFFLLCATNKAMVLQISSPRSFCCNFVIKILLIKDMLNKKIKENRDSYSILPLKITKSHFEKNTKELQFQNNQDSGGGKNRTASLSKVVAFLYWLKFPTYRIFVKGLWGASKHSNSLVV